MSVRRILTRDLRAFHLVAILLVLGFVARGQEFAPTTESGTRDIWDSNLLNKRPAGKGKPHRRCPSTLPMLRQRNRLSTTSMRNWRR